MIAFQHVNFRYQNQQAPVLVDVCVEIDEGTLVLVSGPTGAGKSTLLGAINGHVPHFTGGLMGGRVIVDALDTRDYPPRELAGVVGYVGQDPLRGFVTDTVEDELAYGMEQLGFAPDVMRRRVEDTLDLVSIAELRDRPLRALSGGQQQRAAIASVLAAGAKVLVLDEPTSALDPQSGEEVLATLLRLVHDMGITVVIAEHRLERVLEYADEMLLLDGRGGVTQSSPAQAMRTSPLAPPVVELGRLAGWHPLALNVRDARRLAGPLRQRLGDALPDDSRRAPVPSTTVQDDGAGDQTGLSARDMQVRYGPTVAVEGVAIELPAGQVTALVGRNGAGKSSLLWALTGIGPCQGGRWFVGDTELTHAGAAVIRRSVRLVPQSAGDLLYLESVDEECRAADKQSGMAPGTCREILDGLLPGVSGGQQPRDLSEGQRLALVLAIQLMGRPAVLLLDEPTRGLDYPAKSALGAALRALTARGRAVCLATHDVEFIAMYADRVVVMAQGEVIQAGAVGDVLVASATFTPQVAKTLAPQRWLTVPQVAAGLGA